MIARPLRFAALAAAALLASPALAQDRPVIPNVWDPRAVLERPDMASLGLIRFLTSDDAPPFSFRDKRGVLMGFNVDLARAACEVLKAQCAIQTRPRDTLRQALLDDTGDAVLADVAPPAESEAGVARTQPYFVVPARFAARRDGAFDPATPKGETIASACGSPHEKFLKTFFAGLKTACFPSTAAALAELQAGRVAAVFGEAVGLAFWLHGASSKECCAFAGGPYVDERYFGTGLSVAVRSDDRELRSALDYAMREVHRTGAYEEIYLRYFPVGLF